MLRFDLNKRNVFMCVTFNRHLKLLCFRFKKYTMRVDNRYDMLSKLGPGAFSKVFSGIDIITGEDVAIKIDTSNVKSEQRGRALVICEGDILAWLHKENRMRGIPRLYWSGYISSKKSLSILLS